MRARMRRARRELSAPARAAANKAIINTLRRLPAYRAARRIAAFFAFDGEPDLSPLLFADTAREFHVPVISDDDMLFAAVGPATTLGPNRFGILEPREPALIDPRSLDLVLTPLVAFDSTGNRVGVGAGYYDRCFRFLGGRKRWFRPKLIGVAYSVQEAQPFEPEPWDIPLWGVCTEQGYRQFG